MQIIIGIDLAYAKDIEIAAFWEDGRYIDTHSLSHDPNKDIYITASNIVHFLENMSGGVRKLMVVCEKPFFRNPKITFLMSCLYAMIQYGVRSAGGQFIGVMPSSWQTNMLKLSGPYAKAKERKILSKEVAGKLIGSEIQNEDMGDAICIAKWGVKHRKQHESTI